MTSSPPGGPRASWRGSTRAPATAPVTVGAGARRRAARRCSASRTATHGAFDPAVGPLVDLWRGAGAARRAAASRAAARQRMATRAGARRTARDARRRRQARRRRHRQGHGARRRRRRCCARAACRPPISTSAARASSPSARRRDRPRAGGSPSAGWRRITMHGVLTLRDAALSTSRAGAGPSAAGPIIDPQQRPPGRCAARITTVRAADATTAEAWSKAVIVRGRAAMQRAPAPNGDRGAVSRMRAGVRVGRPWVRRSAARTWS